MRPLYGEPCLRRASTGRVIHAMDRVLSANGAAHAGDLPEEARVRLLRSLTTLLEAEREAEWQRRLGASFIVRVRLWWADTRELCRQALLS